MRITNINDSDIREAKKQILACNKASTSFLQRRMRIGYARAYDILEILEDEGFVGPPDGSKPREILKKDV